MVTRRTALRHTLEDRLTGRRSGALRAVSGCGPSAGQTHSSR
ncbi:hypothetical protein [Streptomyces hygroscopicus]|nr:hypothetical protein [Streptomyces hygroscopicus]